VFNGLYPKKVDKANALRKLDKIHDEDKVEFDDIIAGLKRFIEANKDQEARFIMAPSVFPQGRTLERRVRHPPVPSANPRPRRRYRRQS
jgi:hypothetical protein